MLFNELESARCSRARNTLLLTCLLSSVAGCSSDSGIDLGLTHTVGGELVGLADGNSVTIETGNHSLELTSNGTFQFPGSFTTGDPYAIEIATQPQGQGCEVDNGAGVIADDDVTDIEVLCFNQPELTAVPGIMDMTLSWSGPEMVDVIYSSDPECDWDSYSVCNDGGMMTGISGPEITLGAVADGFDPNTGWYFVVERADIRSNVAAARPVPLDMESRWVSTMARHQDTLFIGGDFSNVAMAVGGGGIVTADSALPFGVMPEVRGYVYDVIADGEGGWFIGGSFDAVDGKPRSNLARIRPDGSLDPDWQAAIDGYAWKLTHDGEKLFVVGGFTQASGEARSNIAVFSDSGAGELDPFQAEPTDSDILAIALSDDLIYVAGKFTNVDGSVRQRFAAFDRATGVLDPDWTPSADGAVDTLVMADNALYTGGRFNNINGTPRKLARIDATNGDLATDFEPNINANVHQLLIDDGTLYVGGNFTSVGSDTRTRLAAFSIANEELLDWNPTVNKGVWALSTHEDRLYVGGVFDTVNGESRLHAAAFDMSTTGELLDWSPNASDTLYGIIQAGDKVYLGGGGPGALPRQNLMALNLETGRMTDWSPAADDEVLSLAVYAGKLYAGGDFLAIDSEGRARLARFDIGSGALDDWNPGVDDSVEALHAVDDVLYAGGEFTTVATENRARLAAFDLTTDLLEADIDLAINFDVNSLATSGGWLFIGGNFTEIEGQSHRLLAAIDRDTGNVDTGWDPGLNAGRVRAIHATEDRLYAGGTIDSVHLAAFDLSDPARPEETSWQPVADSRVRTLSIHEGTVYAGGEFSTINSTDRENLAALSTQDGSLDSDWTPNPGFRVYDTVVDADRNRLYVTGRFNDIDGKTREGIATLDLETGEVIW